MYKNKDEQNSESQQNYENYQYLLLLLFVCRYMKINSNSMIYKYKYGCIND